ncbi:PilW family protein [Stutzerimonas zhaodongensis]|uniref:PilW family protein n=1 Tax=Stutzerimonas zhaodongensis TaxID=1176257 RepID=UPI0039F101C0
MYKQRGISIIEMMVALVISSILMIGITQVYIKNRENVLFQQSQGQNIESARFSILLLEQTLTKAGYRRTPDQTMETAFPKENAGDCGVMETGQVVKRLSETAFCVRYQPAFPDARNCAGDNIADIPEKAYVEAVPVTEKFELANGELTCNNVAIATGITDLKFVYGINTNEEKRISRYASAPEADDNIRAVKLSILTASANSITQDSESKAYVLWFSKDPEPDDKRLYTMLSSSTSMRNLLP